MATVIAVVIACLFLIIVVTLCLLYAYRSERCCFNRKYDLIYCSLSRLTISRNNYNY